MSLKERLLLAHNTPLRCSDPHASVSLLPSGLPEGIQQVTPADSTSRSELSLVDSCASLPQVAVRFSWNDVVRTTLRLIWRCMMLPLSDDFVFMSLCCFRLCMEIWNACLSGMMQVPFCVCLSLKCLDLPSSHFVSLCEQWRSSLHHLFATPIPLSLTSSPLTVAISQQHRCDAGCRQH